MSKYNIEGGIDFFSELYKSLDIEENEQKTEEDNNLCLITSQPLEDKFVQLICGHKFNYKPLYIDITTHKQKFNNFEGHSSKLKLNEIRCPYCRTKQNTVLPYYEELGLEQINGVNLYDPSLISKYNPGKYNPGKYNPGKYNSPKCCYLISNPYYNELSNNVDGSVNTITDASNNISSSSSNSNNKFKSCGVNAYYKITTYIPNYIGDNIYYCFEHKNKIVVENKLKIKEAAKKTKEEAKQKVKEEKLKIKEETKQKLKEEKQKTKEEKQKIANPYKKVKKSVKNDVISETNNITEETVGINNENNENNDNSEKKNGCIGIIKSGPKKGTQCGCLIFNANSYMCKKHHNIQLKNEKIENEKIENEKMKK